MKLRDLIARKRDGGELSAPEWTFVAQGVANDSLPDYQIAALLMACVLRGMTPDETVALTDAMLNSGRSLDLGHLSVARVDKHSTGGVGDKVSLVLAPLVAACGVAVPMVSGRGLGHTGGTLDKLEAIPGFNTRLSLAAAARQVERIGCVIIGQTDEIAPADRKLYAMRDATGTVAAMPLIAASIMSKKLAEGLTGLVLDVKTGVGAFLPTLDEELALARQMVALGEHHNCPVVVLLSNMDFPLGRECGNGNEVEESVAALRGDGPPDLRELTLRLGAEMLVLGGVESTVEAATRRLEAAIASGAALEKFRELVIAQGGDPAVCDDPQRVLAQPVLRVPYPASRDGVVQRVNALTVGRGITALGGGRQAMEDSIDHSVGFSLRAIPGDRVRRGDVLAEILAADSAGVEAGKLALDEAIAIGDAAVTLPPLVSHRVTGSGVERLA
ncbi:MAG: thymidine phosphorylase [Gemmatimonadetes bacterium]|nr:thymidine phosphorylase [Gemmatimonadota bacterium]